MVPAEGETEAEDLNWEYSMTIKEKNDLIDRYTIKGSQFLRPLLEFNGACPGCGETPYIRLLTQLFGERMMIANATGCSSIWGASAPSIAYTTSAKGCGPAWANSLFEDNAEYGYGMYLGVKQIRERLLDIISQIKDSESIETNLKKAFNDWFDSFDEGSKLQATSEKIRKLLSSTDLSKNEMLNQISSLSDYLVKPSVWMIGGDGWAYDIGYGGLDHVLSTGDDVNIFVMDTEVYSNTGGQASKSSSFRSGCKICLQREEVGEEGFGADGNYLW